MGESCDVADRLYDRGCNAVPAWRVLLAGSSDPCGAHLGADLHLWYAQDILGPWTPHAANPDKTDVGSARPAGATFESDGVLYRPAQDSSHTYGGRVVINRVLALTPETFREEPAALVVL